MITDGVKLNKFLLILLDERINISENTGTRGFGRHSAIIG
jgi:hypothetical protein